MKLRRRAVQALLLACTCLVACSEAPAPGVDRIFVGGGIYTLDESQPWAEALAIDGNVVYTAD